MPCGALSHLGGRQTETEQAGDKIQHFSQGHSVQDLKALQCPEPSFSFTGFCVYCEAGTNPSSVVSKRFEAKRTPHLDNDSGEKRMFSHNLLTLA